MFLDHQPERLGPARGRQRDSAGPGADRTARGEWRLRDRRPGQVTCQGWVGGLYEHDDAGRVGIPAHRRVGLPGHRDGQLRRVGGAEHHAERPIGCQLRELCQHHGGQLDPGDRDRLVARQRQPQERAVRQVRLDSDVRVPQLAVGIEAHVVRRDRHLLGQRGILVRLGQGKARLRMDGGWEVGEQRRVGGGCRGECRVLAPYRDVPVELGEQLGPLGAGRWHWFAEQDDAEPFTIAGGPPGSV